MEQKLDIAATVAAKITFASHQNAVPILRDLAVTNPGAEPLTDLVLTIASDPEVVEPRSWPVERIGPGETVRLSPLDLRLNAAMLRNATERTSGRITVSAQGRSGGQDVLLARRDFAVEVLAATEWGGAKDMAELLAAFVMPNDPAVDQILKRASEVLASTGRRDVIDGYESGARTRVWELASAIWSAICALRLTYALPPASFEDYGQKVRVPSAVLSGGVATCLDSAVLFAAVLEQANLNPILVVTKGHAFVGLWLQPQEFNQVLTDEAATLRKRVALSELMVIETTLATSQRNVPFSEAMNTARGLIAEAVEHEFYFALDIRQARIQRILPLSLAAPAPPPPATEAAQAPAAMEAAPALPTFDVELPRGAPATPSGRLDLWQRKLLDLTTRNRLLNTVENATTLRLICPDPAALEDRLAQGQSIRVLPAPRLDAAGRDVALHQEQTGVNLPQHVAEQALARGEVLSPLDPPRLEHALVELYRKGRLDLQEGGANTLFLALGFLNWRRKGAEQRVCRAPLILVPVTLVRKSVRAGIHLTRHEDEARFNLTLLELLRQDFGLTAPALEGALPADSHGIDVDAVWTTVRYMVRDLPGFEVVPDVMLGTFSFAKYLMWKDLAERTAFLKQSPIVRHLLDSPRDPFPARGSVPRPATLDDTVSPAELFTPLPADSSQLAAVVGSAKGLDFVLDGPPGTGKSQTIANMIAHNLALGRRVLFVAEKMAALDVVHRRLEQQGLGAFCLEIHSSKASKAEVIRQLGRAWAARDEAEPVAWAAEAARLKALRDQLNAVVRLLHKPHPNGLTIHRAIGRVVRDGMARSDGGQLPVLAWPSGRVHTEAELDGLRATVHQLDVLWPGVASLDQDAFALAGHDDWSNQWQSTFIAATQALGPALQAAQDAAGAFQAALGLSVGTLDAVGLAALAGLAQRLPAASALNLAWIFEPDAAALADTLSRALAHIAAYRKAEQGLSTRYAPDACQRLDIDRLEVALGNAREKIWPLSSFAMRSIRAELSATGGAREPDPERDLPALAVMRRELGSLERLASQLQRLPGWAGLDSDGARLGAAVEAGLALRLAITQMVAATGRPETRTTLRSVLVDNNDLLGEGLPLARAADAWVRAHAALVQALTAFRNAARPGEHPALAAPLERLPPLLAVLLDRQGALNAWCTWQKARSQALAMDLGPILAARTASADPAFRVEPLFEVAYARWWAGQAIDAEPTLRAFASAAHTDAIRAFRDLDDRLAKLTVAHVKAQVCAGMPARNAPDQDKRYGILRHQLSLKQPRKPIRQLASELGEVMTTLTPCLLMSPLSIAQYLPPDAALFDMVIFDEASQITPWDALGALARGRQAVIAGDPKQMPPTSFFDRAASAQSEEDEVDQDMESILDECLSSGVPSHRLTWHYRSRHESLIAFSNHRYYDGELVTFPAPVTQDRAVSLVPVQGVYAKGRGRTNQAEAEAVVAEVVRRLRDPAFAKKSLAVVTLNAEQQRLIEDLLDQERQRNPEIEPFFDDARPEPVVIKNLETVQGDERDLILLGIGYGPETPGAQTMSMNFGPLNRQGGWRRLNVAITRAREEIVVFASFPPHMVDLNRTSAAAVRDLRHYLEFAITGPKALAQAVHGSVGGSDSPFEEAVAEGLRTRAWTVVPQIGVSRFRIDLGIVHPDRPGDFLLGVECDGASYHSAATARDRDKVRAAVLKGLGWRLLRIWSTDWWIDRKAALDRLDAEITAALADARAKAAEDAARAAAAAAEAAARAEAEAAAKAAAEAEAEARAAEEATANAAPPQEAEAVPSETATAPAETDWEPEPEPAPPVLAAPAPESAAPVVEPVADAPLFRMADLSGHAGVIDPARFHDEAYSPVLETLIAEVVETEAPLRDEVLVTRIARAHGIGRSTSRIQDRVLALARRRFVIRDDPGGGRFVWRDDAQPASLQAFRHPADDAQAREVEAIAIEELRLLARTCPDGDRALAMARKLGLSRLAASTRKRLELALAD